ncbi:MAG: hypothetical protein A2X59_00825 [Nitrospirae bacterium GWC2_42_7]|nr:MAG: hypothetical protein A2X59_00825 [Nitrospirae bacterium GWC2_42_7]
MFDLKKSISGTASLQEVPMFKIMIRLLFMTIFSILFLTVSNSSANDETMQDMANNIKPMSFTTNDDTTLVDDNTGLMWQQQDDGNTYTWYQASGTYDEMYNPASENVCGNLVLSGYADWRLPTKEELTGIVDYAIPFPSETIKTTYFPDTKPSGYWSSTTYENYPDYAWAVYFNDGGVYSSSKYYDVYVRCVRDGQNNRSKSLARTAHAR